MMPGRTPSMCQEKWKELHVDINSPMPWSEQEDILLKQLVGSMGCVWNGVAQFLNIGRIEKFSPKECQARWEKITGLSSEVYNGCLNSY